ncbi:helix-turn-helix domain-containing protein [Halarchaeum sp. P4]|uniref:helix-turn-helix domain-containing protein n=1 Tax=Halarchaeum sp. P4 TaxID=3421639 RepID=UPI003EBC12C2
MSASDDDPDLTRVLDALDDADCRAFLRALDEPMTANELSETCDVPLSTTYRKLEQLTEATLVAEETEIRPDGRHRSRYRAAFDAIELSFDDDRDLVVDLERPARGPSERLADIWSEVQRET